MLFKRYNSIFQDKILDSVEGKREAVDKIIKTECTNSLAKLINIINTGI